MKKEKQEEPEELYLGCLANNGRARVVLWVNPKQKEIDILDTIIHEACHAFQYFYRYAGQTANCDEYMAYTIAKISSTMIQDYRKYYAISEERKTGLQEGTGLGEEEQAGACDATSGEECSSEDGDGSGTGPER